MSVDTTFKPLTPTYAVDSSAAVLIDGSQLGVTSWRIRAVTANGWIVVQPAGGGATAPATPVQPVIGTPGVNVFGVTTNAPFCMEGAGGKAYFRGNALFATSSFEVTGGQGGVGG